MAVDRPTALLHEFLHRQLLNHGLGPSRREQRRKRKAAKNLVMYKTFGRRPWGIADDVLSWPSAYNWTPAKVRHLREPSGFKVMSQRAAQVAFEVAWLRDRLAEFNRLSMSTLFDEAVSYTSERFKELLAAFTLDINAAASAGLSIYDDTEPRTAGCQCQWEAGDSPCRVHGENEEATP